MLKNLRDRAKAKTSSKLAGLMGKKARKDASDDTAQAKAKSGSEAPISKVDGKSAKARTDRPGRRMKRADGGSTKEDYDTRMAYEWPYQTRDTHGTGRGHEPSDRVDLFFKNRSERSNFNSDLKGAGRYYETDEGKEKTAKAREYLDKRRKPPLP